MYYIKGIFSIPGRMEDKQMTKILTKLSLEHVCHRFQKEKITPDIVGKLSSAELESLGVSNASDMMKLRTESIKYGHAPPAKVTVNGKQAYDIPQDILESLLDNSFQISEISQIFCVSESTIYRRMSKYNLSKLSFSDISDELLDEKTEKISQEFLLCDENMIKQMLCQQGIKVQRWRLRDSLHRIDSEGVVARRKVRLHRRIYNVMSPNHLWHIDTNHKLIRWRFVVVGGIDGFSRRVMFLKCCDNNKSETVHQCFLSGVSEYGIPNRVRSDKGLENIDVANFMILNRGPTGMITGRSTHNQRIERLWRDVFEGVLSYFYNLFYFMEDQGILDCLDRAHLQALHYTYRGDINRRLCVWAKAWDAYRMRTTKTSPQALWIAGQMQNLVGVDVNEQDLEHYGVESSSNVLQEMEENERPIFNPLSNMNDVCVQMLSQEVASPRFDVNFAIEDYQNSLRVIRLCNS